MIETVEHFIDQLFLDGSSRLIKPTTLLGDDDPLTPTIVGIV